MTNGMNEIVRKQAAAACLLGLAAIMLYLCYLLAKPFWAPLVIATMLAIVFHPLHARVHSYLRNPSGAATVSTILVLFVAAVPLVVLGISASRELNTVVQLLKGRNEFHGGMSPYLANMGEALMRYLGRYVDTSEFDPQAALLRWAELTSRSLLSMGAAAVTNLFSFLLNTIVVFFSLFFFFREGQSIRQGLIAMLPLAADQTEMLFTGISETMTANLYGGLAVGAAQGLLTGIAFWILGLPAPILWALMTALASLIPVVGSALVWGPAAILLFLSGHWIKAIILLGWGVAMVGQIDVVVRPYIVGAHIKVHKLLVFFALLGGVEAFGIVGIFIGPVILSVSMAIVNMLRKTDFSWKSNSSSTQPVSISEK